MFTINIQNIGGIFYINGKRLGHDTLTPEELQALDEFIREYKHTKKTWKTNITTETYLNQTI